MPKVLRATKNSRGGDFLNLRSRKISRTTQRTSTAPSPRLRSSKRAKVSANLGNTSTPEVPSIPTTSCVVCGDDVTSSLHDNSQWIKAPCTHIYCPECAGLLVATYVRDESLHPIRCCDQPIPKSDIDNLLHELNNPARYALFQDKNQEYSTPAQERTYCPNKKCLEFVPPQLAQTRGRSSKFACPHCSFDICKRCKRSAHPRRTCEAEETKLFQKLVKKKKWQTCPTCGRVVERIDGCSCIICRCGHSFCYNCGLRKIDGRCKC